MVIIVIIGKEANMWYNNANNSNNHCRKISEVIEVS
jgi:hypothetical protein